MVEEVRKWSFSSKEILFPLILLLLIFPPVLRSEMLTVQKVQLLLFLVVGMVFAFWSYREDRRMTVVLFLLFVVFPAVYASGVFPMAIHRMHDWQGIAFSHDAFPDVHGVQKGLFF